MKDYSDHTLNIRSVLTIKLPDLQDVSNLLYTSQVTPISLRSATWFNFFALSTCPTPLSTLVMKAIMSTLSKSLGLLIQYPPSCNSAIQPPTENGLAHVPTILICLRHHFVARKVEEEYWFPKSVFTHLMCSTSGSQSQNPTKQLG